MTPPPHGDLLPSAQRVFETIGFAKVSTSAPDAARLGFVRDVDGVTRTRQVEGGVELHVQGADRLVPRVAAAAERGGFDLVDLSVAEPSLETVFINLTGKELRD